MFAQPPLLKLWRLWHIIGMLVYGLDVDLFSMLWLACVPTISHPPTARVGSRPTDCLLGFSHRRPQNSTQLKATQYKIMNTKELRRNAKDLVGSGTIWYDLVGSARIFRNSDSGRGAKVISQMVRFGTIWVAFGPDVRGGVLQRSAGCVPAGCLAEAFEMPFAEASALVVDKVECFPRGALRKLWQCFRGGQRPRC